MPMGLAHGGEYFLDILFRDVVVKEVAHGVHEDALRLLPVQRQFQGVGVWVSLNPFWYFVCPMAFNRYDILFGDSQFTPFRVQTATIPLQFHPQFRLPRMPSNRGGVRCSPSPHWHYPFQTGRVALDGTKIKANASKHKAMSYDRMSQQEEAIREQVKELMARAAAADAEEDTLFGKDKHGDELPEKLQRRETRLARIR